MGVTTVGGVSVSDTGAAGDLVTEPGDVQYGGVLIPGWADLVGWRDTPDTSNSDSSRSQAHGSASGDVWAESALVDYTFRLPGPPRVPAGFRELGLGVLEMNLPLDSVDRPLVVNDGGGPSMRMARVLKRKIPQDWNFRFVETLECSVQFICADPRRYALAATVVTVGLATRNGGLTYPLAYPLGYGASRSGAQTVTNPGNTAAPVQVTFVGPLINPVLVSRSGWRLAFDITLVAGETLQVDTVPGTVLLNGSTDRLYTISPSSSPVERCQIQTGSTVLTLGAAAGSGTAVVAYRTAYL